MIASSPVSDGSAIFTSPDTMMNRASPGSPAWKMTSPRRNRRVRVPAATRSRASSSSPAKNGIRARDATSGASRAHHRRIVRPRTAARPWVRDAAVGATTASAVAATARRDRVSGRSMPPMTAVPGRLRLTVLGCSTALPAPGRCRVGIPRRVRRHCHPPRCRPGRRRPPRARRGPARAGGRRHRPHARRPFPRPRRRSATCSRGPVAGPSRLPVHLPPGGRSRLDELASAISERAGFFDDAYAVDEYDPAETLDDRAADGPLRAGPPLRAGVGRLGRGARRRAAGLHRRHGTERRDGRVRRAAPTCSWSRRPSTTPSDDDAERGHLTADEAIDLARDAQVGAGTPRPLPAGSPRRNWMRLCAAAGPWIRAGRSRAEPDDRARDRGRPPAQRRSPAASP